MHISLNKAKNLARELTETVHAGTGVATLLNDLIVISESNDDMNIVVHGFSPNADVIIQMFSFYDEVGMLDG